MRNYLFLIPFFLFGCKKADEVSRISVRQQPSKISVYIIDTATGSQTLQYEMVYFYNDSTKRFDSVTVAGNVNRFNYSKLTSDYKILLNYTDSASAHKEIIFDANFYALTHYNEIPASGMPDTYTLQYDTYRRITNLVLNSPMDNNFSQSYSYNIDSVFIHTSKPFNSCVSNDTIINSYYDMSTSLPYLLFTNLHNTCGVLGFNILRAVPISNYVNKLPSKIYNETSITDFTYAGDTYSRLGQAIVATRLRSNNQLTQELKIVVAY